MEKDKFIVKVIVPIVCAVVGVAGGGIFTNWHNMQQNSEINISIKNVLDPEKEGIPISADLQTNTNNLITAYEAAQQELEQQNNEVNLLQSNSQQMQEQIAYLKEENAKLKDFLLKDNQYIDDLDDLVIVKPTSDKLCDLHLIDSDKYDVVEGMRDLYGDTHSVSHKLHPDSTAWAKFRLDSKYDTFSAAIATTQDTGEDVRISVEIYADDKLITRVDDITRDTNLTPVGPVSVHNVKVLTIKALTLEGNSSYGGYCYITDDSLSVVT